MKIKNINRNISLINIFFFSLGGYYAALIIVSNLLSNNLSKIVTMPIRLIIITSIVYLVSNSKLNKKLKPELVFFIIFSFIYLLRILSSSISIHTLYMSPSLFFLYFVSFVFIPYTFVQMINLKNEDYEFIFKIILTGSVMVSILTYFFYGDLLGQVGRITDEVGKDDNYISPLALSYTSILGINICFSYLVSRKSNVKIKTILFFAILICLIPFYLGASRGSVLAFLFSISIYFLFSKGLLRSLKLMMAALGVALLLYLLGNYIDTNVFDRVLNISSGIENQNTSAIRLYLWESAFSQFLNNPFWGDSLELKVASHHPHNIIVEVLMSTGMIGFLPFIIFISCIFIKAIKIIRESPKMYWVTNIFFIGFMMNMFSGAIWGASWLAIGAALISGYNLRKNSNE